MSAIEVVDLHKSYRDVHALRGVSFKFDKGVLGLLGPNGAGKTTLIKILIGLLKPDKGYARVFGYDCQSEGLKVRRILGYLGEDHRFYEYMRCEEYLRFVARLKGLDKRDVDAQVDEVLEKVGLSDVRRKRIREFSQGMKQRLGLG